MLSPAKIVRALAALAAVCSVNLSDISPASAAPPIDMTPIEDGAIKWTLHPAAFDVTSWWSEDIPKTKTSTDYFYEANNSLYEETKSLYVPRGCFLVSDWVPLQGSVSMMAFPNMSLATSFYNVADCGEKCWRHSMVKGYAFDDPKDPSLVKTVMQVQIEVDTGKPVEKWQDPITKTYKYPVTTRGMSFKARSGFSGVYDLTRSTSPSASNPIVFQPDVKGTRFRIKLCDRGDPLSVHFRGMTVWTYPN